jgi:hypothetical protein
MAQAVGCGETAYAPVPRAVIEGIRSSSTHWSDMTRISRLQSWFFPDMAGESGPEEACRQVPGHAERGPGPTDRRVRTRVKSR